MFAAILFAVIGLTCAAGALFLALMVGTTAPKGGNAENMTEAEKSSIRLTFTLSIAAQIFALACAMYIGTVL